LILLLLRGGSAGRRASSFLIGNRKKGKKEFAGKGIVSRLSVYVGGGKGKVGARPSSTEEKKRIGGLIA